MPDTCAAAGAQAIRFLYRSYRICYSVSFRVDEKYTNTLMAAEKCVVIEVTKANVDKIWPQMQQDLLDATFIAVDTEMSGLGNKGATFQSNIEERYKAVKDAAMSRSLISLGLACFKFVRNAKDTKPLSNGHQDEEDRPWVHYHAKVYNIILLCEDPFCVDPDAVQFLAEHAFDFNKLFTQGIPYKRGRAKGDNDSIAKQIFAEIIRNRKPLVFHNGFADLVFLYQCLYTTCPKKLSTFLADLSEMFPCGIYDMKRIACNHVGLKSSFLLYVYKRHELINVELSKSNNKCVSLTFEDESNNITTCAAKECRALLKNQESVANRKVCDKYAKYGWCFAGRRCKHSHNIDDIIALHDSESKSRRNRKRNTKTNGSRSADLELMDVQPLDQDETGAANEQEVDDICSGLYDQNKGSVIAEQTVGPAKKRNKRKRRKRNSESPYKTKNGQEAAESIPADQDILPAMLDKMDDNNDNIDTDKTERNGSKPIHPVEGNCHKAGMDAFMAGFSFAVFTVSHSQDKMMEPDLPEPGKFSSVIPFLSDDLKGDLMNKLYLSGKRIPLWICRSHYTKTSPDHDSKLLEIFL